MLLVTQYHERGSLYDYLSRPDTSLTQQIAFKLIESALKGLDHLHKEVHAAGVYNLPSMYSNPRRTLLVIQRQLQIIFKYYFFYMHVRGWKGKTKSFFLDYEKTVQVRA